MDNDIVRKWAIDFVDTYKKQENVFDLNKKDLSSLSQIYIDAHGSDKYPDYLQIGDNKISYNQLSEFLNEHNLNNKTKIILGACRTACGLEGIIYSSLSFEQMIRLYQSGKKALKEFAVSEFNENSFLRKFSKWYYMKYPHFDGEVMGYWGDVATGLVDNVLMPGPGSIRVDQVHAIRIEGLDKNGIMQSEFIKRKEAQVIVSREDFDDV